MSLAVAVGGRSPHGTSRVSCLKGQWAWAMGLPRGLSLCVSPSGCVLLWYFWLVSVDPPPTPFFLNTLAKHLEGK